MKETTEDRIKEIVKFVEDNNYAASVLPSMLRELVILAKMEQLKEN